MRTKANQSAGQKLIADAAKGKPATFWMRASHRKELEAISQRTGTSISFLINRALVRFLENPDPFFGRNCHTSHTSSKEKA